MNLQTDHPSSVKRRFLMQPSKKIGCPAYLSVKVIRVVNGSDYELEKQNAHDMKKVILTQWPQRDRFWFTSIGIVHVTLNYFKIPVGKTSNKHRPRPNTHVR